MLWIGLFNKPVHCWEWFHQFHFGVILFQESCFQLIPSSDGIIFRSGIMKKLSTVDSILFDLESDACGRVLSRVSWISEDTILWWGWPATVPRSSTEVELGLVWDFDPKPSWDRKKFGISIKQSWHLRKIYQNYSHEGKLRIYLHPLQTLICSSHYLKICIFSGNLLQNNINILTIKHDIRTYAYKKTRSENYPF